MKSVFNSLKIRSKKTKTILYCPGVRGVPFRTRALVSENYIFSFILLHGILYICLFFQFHPYLCIMLCCVE